MGKWKNCYVFDVFFAIMASLVVVCVLRSLRIALQGVLGGLTVDFGEALAHLGGPSGLVCRDLGTTFRLWWVSLGTFWDSPWPFWRYLSSSGEVPETSLDDIDSFLSKMLDFERWILTKREREREKTNR